MVETPYKLGRHVEHDEQSRGFAFTAPTAPTRHSVQHATAAPVLNQGSTNGCVGNAFAQLLGTQMFAPVLSALHHKSWLTETEALNIYHVATHADGLGADFYPPNDDGTSALGGAKALQQLGFIDRYLHTFTFTDFLAAIQQQPVTVGSDWTDQMFGPDKKGFVHPGPLNDSTIVGGHEYLARGVNFTSQTLTFRNSWGPSWAVGGEFYMSFKDFQTLLKHDGDVLMPHGINLP